MLCSVGDGRRARWGAARGKVGDLAAVSAPCALVPGKRAVFSLKRRRETVALLLDHRLLFVAPMPSPSWGALRFLAVPHGCTLEERRGIFLAAPAFWR
ncbi:MAG TPA: hypothetical protein VGM23_10905 [Armatimonadota bacterium]|jgi:hypothetical protein